MFMAFFDWEELSERFTIQYCTNESIKISTIVCIIRKLLHNELYSPEQGFEIPEKSDTSGFKLERQVYT